MAVCMSKEKGLPRLKDCKRLGKHEVGLYHVYCVSIATSWPVVSAQVICITLTRGG